MIRPNYITSKKRKVLQFKKAQWGDLEAECDNITKEIQNKYKEGDDINSHVLHTYTQPDMLRLWGGLGSDPRQNLIEPPDRVYFGKDMTDLLARVLETSSQACGPDVVELCSGEHSYTRAPLRVQAFCCRPQLQHCYRL